MIARKTFRIFGILHPENEMFTVTKSVLLSQCSHPFDRRSRCQHVLLTIKLRYEGKEEEPESSFRLRHVATEPDTAMASQQFSHFVATTDGGTTSAPNAQLSQLNSQLGPRTLSSQKLDAYEDSSLFCLLHLQGRFRCLRISFLSPVHSCFQNHLSRRPWAADSGKLEDWL